MDCSKLIEAANRVTACWEAFPEGAFVEAEWNAWLLRMERALATLKKETSNAANDKQGIQLPISTQSGACGEQPAYQPGFGPA